MRLFKASVVLIATLITQHVGAATFSTATVASGVTWSASSNVPALTACTHLITDVSGNLATLNRMVIYGYLACGKTVIPITGTAALLGGGINFAFGATILGGPQLLCNLNSSTLSGACTVANTSGNYLGALNLSYIP